MISQSRHSLPLMPSSASLLCVHALHIAMTLDCAAGYRHHTLLSVCQSVCLSVCLFVCLSVCPYIHKDTHDTLTRDSWAPLRHARAVSLPNKDSLPPPPARSLLPPPTPILHPLALPLTSAISGLHEVIRSLTPIFRILRLLGPDAHNSLRLTLRVTVRQPDLPSLWCVCVCARARVCARYFCDRSPPCSWAVVAPTSSCPCIRERLYQKKTWMRSNALNDNEHEHEHARTHACKHAHAYTRIHVHTTDWHFYQASSSATSSASSSAGGRCDHGSSWKRGSSAGPKGLSGSREAATMNHSQTIVSCTMTCALAREHGSEHGSERGTNSPDGRSSGHAPVASVQLATENRASSWMATDSS